MKTVHLKILTLLGVLVIIALLVHRIDPKLGSSPTTTTTSTIVTTTTSTTTTTTTGSSPGTVASIDYDVGQCVIWDQSASDAQPYIVSCSKPHIFEVTGKASMPAGRFPKPDQWTALDSDAGGQCYDLAVTYVGGQLWPDGKYSVGSIDPVQSAWDDGQTWAWCGVIVGTNSNIWPTSRGSAEGAG